MTEASSVPEAMTIHQLAEQSGVPARRIRHFISEGLLPPPRGRGRAAHYGPQHLSLLAQISALRARNLSLDEIRDRLRPVGDAAGARPGAGECWERWSIAPGVELHVRADLEPETSRAVRALVRVARQLVASDWHDGIELTEESRP